MQFWVKFCQAHMALLLFIFNEYGQGYQRVTSVDGIHLRIRRYWSYSSVSTFLQLRSIEIFGSFVGLSGTVSSEGSLFKYPNPNLTL
jgi:hypothetical protein